MEDAIPLSNYELECEMDKNTEKIKKLEKCISDLEKSNVKLGWKLGELETELAKIRKPAKGPRRKTLKLNYLTEKEAKMPLDMALLQLALGLQSCNSKEEAVNLLKDAVELGRREG